MATWERSTRRSTAFSSVVGLLLLALLLVASTPAWYGNDPDNRSFAAATDVWAPAGWLVQTSAVPPVSSGGAEHLPAHWQLRQSATPEVPAAQPLLVPMWPDPGAIRSPQQTAHRTAGSRSPPSA